MRRGAAKFLLLLPLLAGTLAPARADHRPSLVVDPATGVPLELREGDWGLHRPGAPPRTAFPLAPLYALPPAPPFFPSAGKPPRVGRVERERPATARRRASRADRSFYRAWSAASAPTPADLGSRTEPLPIIVAPRSGPRWRDPGPQPELETEAR